MDKTLQTKVIQLEYMNQQISAMRTHLEQLLQAIEELSVLRVGLTNLETAKTGDEMLVPLGASSYVPAEITTTGKVIVSLGAGVFVEKKISEATPIVDKQVEDLKKQEDVIVQNIGLLTKESDKLTGELNAAIQANQSV
ncbi:MAG: prefoldin subunit alpha [Candidatus Altiarchaeota archaeon]|nr:prefoldin subunit alpha [Candidatus Altiarchaeota archaeon]